MRPKMGSPTLSVNPYNNVKNVRMLSPVNDVVETSLFTSLSSKLRTRMAQLDLRGAGIVRDSIWIGGPPIIFTPGS